MRFRMCLKITEASANAIFFEKVMNNINVISVRNTTKA